MRDIHQLLIKTLTKIVKKNKLMLFKKIHYDEFWVIAILIYVVARP